jgi:hypothetical protein
VDKEERDRFLRDALVGYLEIAASIVGTSVGVQAHPYQIICFVANLCEEWIPKLMQNVDIRQYSCS